MDGNELYRKALERARLDKGIGSMGAKRGPADYGRTLEELLQSLKPSAEELAREREMQEPPQPQFPDRYLCRTASDAVGFFARQFGLEDWRHLPNWQAEAVTKIYAVHTGIYSENAKKRFGQIIPGQGIVIMGDSQIGKTSVFEFMKKVHAITSMKTAEDPKTGELKILDAKTQGITFRIASAYQIAKDVELHGARSLDTWLRGQYLFIDEMGWESRVANYANKHDCIAEILHERHRKGLVTHVAGNQSWDSLKEKYDGHIVARLLQMNIVNCGNAPSFIKNKLPGQ